MRCICVLGLAPPRVSLPPLLPFPPPNCEASLLSNRLSFLPFYSETLVLPFAPREVTQWVSFPAILAVLIISDIIYLRRGHLAPFQWAQVDYMAHLTGYAVGIGVGELLRVRRGQSQVKRDKEKEKKARVVGGVE